MIKEIIKDDFFLKQKSVEADQNDLYIIDDLLDTIKKYNDSCVGMAANMIGYLKRIIVVLDGNEYLVLINPEIMKCFGSPYTTEEGCLSHQGTKPTKRYSKIKVFYFDKNMKKKIKTFDGFTAQIIQHEIDHLNGILI